ncbi:cupin domain-containing protein [Aquabacterium sp.]|uniref:cupin domain-containing protein n=1 Tax=Aquabacterium sp. TaxID=1872578 RepID=UPI0024889738|nr:cupin domain-containing protein [Aquabacterium sp.]MDI1351028.1 cupin domain-containing protein [Aquabacterium sp.]
MVSIVRMAQPDEGGAIDHPRPERLVRGNPRRETWPLYETADGVTSVGIWACEVGMWRIVFAPNKEEYFFVLEGHVRLHARDGAAVDVRAGEGAVIPAGFEGAFEVVSPVRKHFVVVTRPV